MVYQWLNITKGFAAALISSLRRLRSWRDRSDLQLLIGIRYRANRLREILPSLREIPLLNFSAVASQRQFAGSFKRPASKNRTSLYLWQSIRRGTIEERDAVQSQAQPC
jgi:hypothetical protein